MQGITASPSVLTTINYEAEDEKASSEYQVNWTNIMNRRKYRNPTSYKKVEVLLLRWKDDDLQTGGEVTELSKTFERQSAPQESSSTEHGMNALVWNGVEKLLKDADADVLEIFDCCHAAHLGLVRGHQRTFEYIAATKANAATPAPGPESFTSALIFALNTLYEEKPQGRFTALDIVSIIRERAPHFPKEQVPKLFNRVTNASPGRIMLHPLQAGEVEAPPASPDQEIQDIQDHAKKHTMTLHFDLSIKMEPAVLDQFGTQLNNIFDSHAFGVNNVRWGGMKPGSFARAARKLHRIADKVRQDSNESSQQRPARLRLLTPVSEDMHSPRAQQSLAKHQVDTSPTTPSAQDASSEESGQPSRKRLKRKDSLGEELEQLGSWG